MGVHTGVTLYRARHSIRFSLKQKIHLKNHDIATINIFTENLKRNNTK